VEKEIRVLLVDDHQVVREGLRHMLGREEDIEVVGEAADAKLALSQVELLSPDVILMDIKMPGVDGIELTRRVKEKQLPCNVIMLTLYDEYLSQAIEAGAAGYLLKDAKRTELIQAIRQVHRGEVVISESITPKSQIEYEDRTAGKTEENPLETNDSDTMLEEVELIIHPPVDGAQLIIFISQVEEAFQSHTLQLVGSWMGGTAITISLQQPTPVVDVLNILGELCDLETAGEKPLTEGTAADFPKKASAVPRSETRPSKTIFATLRTYPE